MNINILGSGSNGNCIVVTFNNNYQILLDVGVAFKYHLSLNLSSINLCLITHEHDDHIAYLKDFIANNKRAHILVPQKILNANILKKSFVNDIIFRANFFKNDLTIKTYEVKHDCIQNHAYIVFNTDKSVNLAYLTDASFIPENFIKDILEYNITNIFVESNWDDCLLSQNLKYTSNEGKLYYLNRARRTHLSNEQTLAFCKSIDNMKRNVLLTHLSRNNNIGANKLIEYFKKNLKNLNVFVAHNKTTIKWD